MLEIVSEDARKPLDRDGREGDDSDEAGVKSLQFVKFVLHGGIRLADLLEKRDHFLSVRSRIRAALVPDNEFETA